MVTDPGEEWPLSKHHRTSLITYTEKMNCGNLMAFLMTVLIAGGERALPASRSDDTITPTRFSWEDLLGRVSCPLCSMLQNFLWAESLVCVTKWPNTYNFLAEKVREKAKSIHSKEIWKIHHANISGTSQAAHQ